MYLFICFAFIIIFLYLFGDRLRKRFFAWFIDRFTKNKDPKYEEMKKELFKTMQSHVSHLPELRKEKAIKVLEVGVGTGANLEYYPEKTRLVVVDPNPHFQSYYDKNRLKYPNIHSESIVTATGEEMDFVESNSVDVVVMTLVLCSVQDVSKVLRQVFRVLAPGGTFYFFEHVVEWDGKKHPYRLALHKFLTGSSIWPVLFDGCHLNRDPASEIKEVGFSKISGQHSYAPINHFIFQIIQPHYCGYAEK